MDSFNLAEFAKNSENKEDAGFTPAVQEAGIEQGSLIVSRLYNTMLGEVTRVLKSWNSELTKILTEAGITPSALSNEQLYTAINTLIESKNMSTKADTDLANVTTAGKTLSNSWISPNWSSSVTISKSVWPYTFAEYGWYVFVLQGNAYSDGSLYLNNIRIGYMQSGGTYWVDGSSGMIRVQPGDVLSGDASLNSTSMFLPDKQ